jgi:hypothetical protein
MKDIIDPATGELMDTDSVPGLAAVAALHDDQIYRLAAAVSELQDGVASKSAGAADGPVVWQELDSDAAAKTWKALADWVAWLRGRYPLARQVPPCWWRHPELVEETTALWLAWKDAYLDNGAPLTAAADWHCRWLPEYLRRIGAGGWNIACEGEHKERVTGMYDARGVDNSVDFKRFLEEDAVNRRIGDDPQFNEEAGVVDENTMKAALESGDARRIGDLPDSPVAYRGEYWVPGEREEWVRVVDEDIVAFLDDAMTRMRMADEAVARAQES